MPFEPGTGGGGGGGSGPVPAEPGNFPALGPAGELLDSRVHVVAEGGQRFLELTQGVDTYRAEMVIQLPTGFTAGFETGEGF